MGDSETEFQAGASHAALMAELSSLRHLLAEKDNQLSNLVDQLNDRIDRLTEQDERLAGLVKLIRILQDEIRLLKKLPRRPDLKPSGLAASMQGNEGKPAAGSSSGSKRSKKDGKGRKKGRGPRRRNPNLHRREVKVSLDDVPEGAERKGYQAHTVRDIVFFAEEVAWLREVWQFPDGSRHVAPLPPGVATGRRQHGPGKKRPAVSHSRTDCDFQEHRKIPQVIPGKLPQLRRNYVSCCFRLI